MEYSKIQTLFKRDEKNIIMPEFTTPIFKWLLHNEWEYTLKVDGTNTRIELHRMDGKWNVEFAGRTSKSNMPKPLADKLNDYFSDFDWHNVFPEMMDGTAITIYGEGYGNKIQTPGKDYIPDGVDYILFDVMINGMWLTRQSCEDIASKMGINIVPIMFKGYTLYDVIKKVQEGFKDPIAYNKELNAEGIVARTPYGLLDRRGNRVIVKVKTRDFRQYKATYGIDFNCFELNKILDEQ